jgi:hypothetical protein
MTHLLDLGLRLKPRPAILADPRELFNPRPTLRERDGHGVTVWARPFSFFSFNALAVPFASRIT